MAPGAGSGPWGRWQACLSYALNSLTGAICNGRGWRRRRDLSRNPFSSATLAEAKAIPKHRKLDAVLAVSGVG